MDQLTDPKRRNAFVDHIIEEAGASADGEGTATGESRAYQSAPATLRSKVARDVPAPVPPFWGHHVVPSIDPYEVWRQLDLNSLFRFQWGGSNKKGLDYTELVEREFKPMLAELQRTTIKRNVIEPRIIYGYYPCNSDGNDLILYNPRDHTKPAGRMSFPRQSTEEHLCIADYFAPVASGRIDMIAMQIVTVGERVEEYCAELQKRGDYSEGYFTHGLAVTTTEALAGYSNQLIRDELGLPPTRGKRFSWGYGACPNLADQAVMFQLLPGQEIGVTLTDGFQLSPDASTAAFIVHHPEAKYFSAYKHGKTGAASDAAG